LVGFALSTKCRTAICTQGSHPLTFKNSRICPGLSRTPRTFFPDVVAAQQYLNVKINDSYSKYTTWHYNPQKSRLKAEEGKLFGGAANPLPPARGSGECCKLPQGVWGLPQKPSIVVEF